MMERTEMTTLRIILGEKGLATSEAKILGDNVMFRWMGTG
jgi:hypothetical protein